MVQEQEIKGTATSPPRPADRAELADSALLSPQASSAAATEAQAARAPADLLAFGETVAAAISVAPAETSLSFDATVAAPPLTSGPAQAAHAAHPSSVPVAFAFPGPGSFPMRATVLPRIELINREPALIAQGKPRYERIRVLGEGGTGEVIGAQDNDIGRKVAVKRLHADQKTPSMLARFVEEIRTIGRLEHPNIIPIHDVGVDEHGEYYFVMKYVDGETLESIIAKLAKGDPDAHRRYTFQRRVQIFMSLLEAVAFAHARGIVHRDIKPANVMIGAYGEVLLMDWGLAKPVRAEQAQEGELLPLPHRAPEGERERLFRTQVGSLLGTPAYMAPEQARGDEADERSDIYALSALFYELLCLQHYLAHKATLAEMLSGVLTEEPLQAKRIKSPHQPKVPPDLSYFVQKGLAKDPAARHPSAVAMIADLERRAEGKIHVSCHVTLMKRLSSEWLRFLDRHPRFAALALTFVLVYLVVAAAVGIWGLVS